MARAGLGAKKLAEVQDHRLTWERDRQALAPYYKAIDREYNYCLKLDHHQQLRKRDGNRNSPEPLQVSTLDLYDAHRYGVSEIAGSLPYVDARPVTPGKTEAEEIELEEASQTFRAVMLEQVTSVDIGYPHARRAMIRLADAARAGAIKLDVVPGGEHGADVVPCIVDARNLSWDTRYAHFNLYGNRRLYERVTRVPLDEIKARYKNGDLVKPDNGSEQLPVEAEPKVDRDKADPDTATLVIAWEMGDEEEVPQSRTKKLDPSNYYMACDTCDYSEEDLAEAPAYDGSTLPAMMPCPKCGVNEDGQPAGYAHRVETDTEIGARPAYKNGNRRFVFAPFSPEAGYLEDGDWPEGLTKFPYAMYVPDPFPLEPLGNSRTFLSMDIQSLKNATLAEGFQQIQRNKDILLAKKDSLWTAENEPYQFDGTGDLIAYVSTYDDLQGIKQFQGAGLNSAFPAWWDILDGEAASNRGIGQVSGTPQELKGVQVGTAARARETGDVPLDEMLRILREAEEGLFNRWAELLCGNATEAWWVEVAGLKGKRVHRLFDPMSHPRMRIRVHASPKLDAVEIEQGKALRDLATAGSPTLMRYLGQQANLPAALVEEIIAEVSMLKPAAPAGMDAPPGFSPAGGAQGVPPALPELPVANVAAV